MADTKKDLKLYFTVRDSFGDNVAEAQYVAFDAARAALEKYCARTDVDVDGAWLGVVYKDGEKEIRCALVQNHVTPNYCRFRSMYNNLSERALAVPEIELVALKARQMEFPFDEETQKRIDALEKSLGVFERDVKTVGDLHVGKWRVHIVPPGGHYGLNNNLTNKNRESLVEFWDMSAKKSAFPDGQFVTRYGLESLYDTTWGPGAEAMMRGGLCLDGDNADVWSVSGNEMIQVFDWLKKRELLPGENYRLFSGEADVPFGVVDCVPLTFMDSHALASEAVLTQRLDGLAFVRDLHVERAGEYKNGTGYTFSFSAQADPDQIAVALDKALTDIPHEVSFERGFVPEIKKDLNEIIESCENVSKYRHRAALGPVETDRDARNNPGDRDR